MTFFVLLLAARDSGGSDHRSPPSMCVSLTMDTVLCHVNQLPPDSSFIFSLSPSPSLLEVFVWIVLAHAALRGRVEHSSVTGVR